MNSTAPMISCNVPSRPAGVWATYSATFVSESASRVDATSMNPGAIALTRTDSGPSSAAIARVMPATPAFAAL